MIKKLFLGASALTLVAACANTSNIETAPVEVDAPPGGWRWNMVCAGSNGEWTSANR